MKRTIGILAGLAALGAAVYLGNQVWADGAATTTAHGPALQSKIAIINIAHVIKNYKKFIAFQDKLKVSSEPLKKEIENKKAVIATKETEMNKAETPLARREQLQREIKAIQREVQDKVDEANQHFAKERADELKMLYMDIQDAVTRYARAYAIELVLQYSDGSDAAEKYSPAALQAKLANSACFPIYNDPQMDITASVTQWLNQQLGSAAATPAGVKR